MSEKPLVACHRLRRHHLLAGCDSTDVLDYPDFGRKLPIEEVVGRYRRDRGGRRNCCLCHSAAWAARRSGLPEWLELAATIHRVAAERPNPQGVRRPAWHGDAGGDGVLPPPGAQDGQDRRAGRCAAAGQRAQQRRGMNLLGAVRVAIDPAASGLGVLVALNDEIQSRARGDENLHLSAADLPLAGFRCARPHRWRRRPDLPAAGAAARARYRVRLSDVQSLPRVDIAYSYGGRRRHHRRCAGGGRCARHRLGGHGARHSGAAGAGGPGARALKRACSSCRRAGPAVAASPGGATCARPAWSARTTSIRRRRAFC